MASRIVVLGLLCAALASLGVGRAAAQETEYDPQGRRLPPTTLPDGYVSPDATPPASVPPTVTPPSDAIPPGAPPPSAIPAPPPAPEAPPGPYRLEADDTPHYPTLAADDADETRTDEGVRIPSRISARLRALDRDFTALSVRGSSGVLDGILSIVSGGLLIALGAVIEAPDGFATYLYVFGAASVAHGIVDLFLTPDPVDPALIFAHMPMGSVDEVKARLRFGEESLEGLADRSRLARIITGSLDVGTGLAFIPLYLGPRDYKLTGDYLDIFVVIGALIRVITGVVTLVMRSEAERRWSAYDTLRNELRQERRARPAVRASLGAAPLPGGGVITLGGSF